jgi:hypothetical protein
MEAASKRRDLNDKRGKMFLEEHSRKPPRRIKLSFRSLVGGGLNSTSQSVPGVADVTRNRRGPHLRRVR